MSKEFKTIEEQLSILEKRGLKIEDKEIARDFLLLNNYYRISGYSLTLREHDIFYENVKFQNIIDIYNFDYELRHILLKYIEKIEVSFKSVYAHFFSEMYGKLEYRKSINFTDPTKHLKLIKKVDELANKNIEFESCLKHYAIDLKEEYPMWVFIELFTISDISKMYRISKNELKEKVAFKFNYKMSNGYEFLEKHMHSITIIRNLCAHNSRLYNRLFVSKPNLNSKEKQFLNRDENGEYDNSHLFGFIMIMRRLLERKDFIDLKKDIIELTHKYPFVSLKYYGFGPNWNDL